ncbi:hypothetical protein [Trueperella pyogenes]|uniref:hypothetical protein n=1 Tax=Trueperella pyogenes TaxID=1661 RepID=UPI0023DD8E6A|nr:hypothetical protein [Trueperella pyogenes]
MPSHTDLVARIGEAGALPANRPIDHARRITTGGTIGAFFGTLVALFWLVGRVSIAKDGGGADPVTSTAGGVRGGVEGDKGGALSGAGARRRAHIGDVGEPLLPLY